jgi:hypothetical protein
VYISICITGGDLKSPSQLAFNFSPKDITGAKGVRDRSVPIKIIIDTIKAAKSSHFLFRPAFNLLLKLERKVLQLTKKQVDYHKNKKEI